MTGISLPELQKLTLRTAGMIQVMRAGKKSFLTIPR